MAFRDTETNFRRYEPHLLEWLKAPHAPFIIDPSPLAATTFVGRMRDAISAYLADDCSWGSVINKLDLRLWWGKSTITEQGDRVRVGPRLGRTAKKVGTQVVAPSEDPTKGLDIIAIHDLSPYSAGTQSEIIERCCYLLTRKILVGRFVFTHALPFALGHLAIYAEDEFYDIAFEHDDMTHTTTIL